MAARARDAVRPLSELLAEVSAPLLDAPVVYSERELARILSPRHFVDVRRTFGGPAPEETARAAAVSAKLLEADEAWWTKATGALGAAERSLRERSAAL
jgi:argininosuccinate lyase